MLFQTFQGAPRIIENKFAHNIDVIIKKLNLLLTYLSKKYQKKEAFAHRFYHFQHLF